MLNKYNDKPGLSVLMSVYRKDQPEHLEDAIASIINQTRQADEIVLVKDGPLKPQLDLVVDKWVKKRPASFKIVTLPENAGLGPALMAGMKKCSYEIIARMDADDISMPQRFQKQVSFLSDHPQVDLVCSWTGQFEAGLDKIMFKRGAPSKHKKIARLAKFRNPIDHGTVMYRRSGVLAVGGYSHIPGFEDYHLWVRMMANGARMACIPEVLYKFRWNRNMLRRRRGFSYLRRWLTLEKEFLRMGFISLPIFVFNVIIRTAVHLMPLGVLRQIRRLLRF